MFKKGNTDFQKLGIGLPGEKTTSLSRGDQDELDKNQISSPPSLLCLQGTQILCKGRQSFSTQSQSINTGQTKVKPVSLLNTNCIHHSGLVKRGLSVLENMLESPLPELPGAFCFFTELRIWTLKEVNLEGTGFLHLKRQTIP